MHGAKNWQNWTDKSTNLELLGEISVCLFQLLIEQVDRKSVKVQKMWINLSNNLVDIYKTLHLTAEYTLFSSTHRTFTKIDHILGQKTSLSNVKMSQFIQSKFFWTK